MATKEREIFDLHLLIGLQCKRRDWWKRELPLGREEFSAKTGDRPSVPATQVPAGYCVCEHDWPGLFGVMIIIKIILTAAGPNVCVPTVSW